MDFFVVFDPYIKRFNDGTKGNRLSHITAEKTVDFRWVFSLLIIICLAQIFAWI